MRNEDFLNACLVNDLNKVTELLNDGADISYKEDEGLILACALGYEDLVQFLLSSKKIKTHANANARDSYALYYAFQNGHDKIAKLLLSASENAANLESIKNKGFKIAYENNCTNMLELLIFSYLIDKTKFMDDFLNSRKNEKKAKEIKIWFKKAALNKKINKEIDKLGNTDIENNVQKCVKV